ncbi:hypothetical protein Agub_g2133, partial [Astrephomene gubernaculifera]
MDFDDGWDADWEPLVAQPAKHQPAPSGFSDSSRAAPNIRPTVSSGRQPVKMPAIASGMRGRRHPAAGLPAAPVVQAQTANFRSLLAQACAQLPSQPNPHQQPKQQPPQQLLPCHRTMLNYAIDVFFSHLAPWTQQPHPISLSQGQQSDPDRHVKTMHGGGEQPTAAAPTSAAALSSDALEQLESILFALQSSLGDSNQQHVTRRDREDLWRLCSACWEASSTAARAVGSTPGAAEQSRVLQSLGGKLYDLANKQPPLAAPDGRAAAGASGGGGCGGEGGCLGGPELFARVKFFHRMGRMWLAMGHLQQAGWYLARAREGLGQLQAEEEEANQGANPPPPPQQQQRRSTTQMGKRPGRPTSASTLFMDGDEGAGEAKDEFGLGLLGLGMRNRAKQAMGEEEAEEVAEGGGGREDDEGHGEDVAGGRDAAAAVAGGKGVGDAGRTHHAASGPWLG